MSVKKFAIKISCVTWLLAATVAASSHAEEKAYQASGCPSDDLSKFATKYAKDLQKRVLDIINFAKPDGRDWLIKQANFKRRLLVWGFRRMDRNINGLVDFNEAVRGRWSLRGSRVCQVAFLQQCDKDQERSVSLKEWLNCFIPECNKHCVRGQLDTVRCECQCPENVIQGRVVTSSGVPLNDVSISFGFSTNKEIARTNRSGHFSMIDRCDNSSYTVRKNDYIPLRLEGGIQTDLDQLLIHLEDAEPASITVNPKRKTRIAGQSANFTCEAEGTPPIKISWYKNGRQLQEGTLGTKSNLYIPNVDGAQGLYTCKATNDYGSEISTPAELKIKEDVLDTCNRTPSSHIIKLPPGCKESSTGEDTVDVGQCSDEPCSRSAPISDTCGAKDDCCCVPVEEGNQEKIKIDCSDFGLSDMVLFRVKECGCRTCAKTQTEVKGEVVSGPNQEPIKNVKVIFRQKVVDTTNEEGKFSLTIPDDVDRVAVTFHDPADQFMDTTQTIPIQMGQTVFHRIVLQEEDPPVTFDSSQDLIVPLGHAGDSMAELELPADNLLQKDGKPFKGKAKLRVSLTDPRNVTDLMSAPGDFTTVDQSGDVQPLKTYGILRIKVQDEDNQQLDLAGNMKIYLDADKIKLPSNSTGEIAPVLWWLDTKTGRWRQIEEMKPVNNSRTKRSLGGRRFYIGNIPTDKLSTLNIDIPAERCYVRAQAYTITDKGIEQTAGVRMTLIGSEATDQEQYNGYTESITNKNGIACIPAWCDSNAVLQSSKESFYSGGSKVPLYLDSTVLEKLPRELETSVLEGNRSRSFQFTTKVASQTGPIFFNDEYNKCLDLSDNLVAFKFYFNETTFKLREIDDFGSRPPGHRLSWYTSDASKPNQEPMKCFIKVRSFNPAWSKATWVSVQSGYILSLEREGEEGIFTKYGHSIRELTQTIKTEGNYKIYKHDEPFTMKMPSHALGSACIEYRCSEKNKETNLIFTSKNQDFEKSPFFVFAHKYWWKHRERAVAEFFNVPADVSDGKLGFYSGRGKIAEQRCQAGKIHAVNLFYTD